MKQIKYRFKQVSKVRLEFSGYDSIIYIKFHKGEENAKTNREILDFIDLHRGFCSRVLVKFDWLDGPELPSIFEGLNEYELRLIESCSGTTGDIEAALKQGISWITKIQVKNAGPGKIKILISAKNDFEVDQKDLNHIEHLAELLTCSPNVDIDIVLVNEDQIKLDHENLNSLHFFISEASERGIKDAEIKRIYELDEDLFKDSAKKHFNCDLDEIIPMIDSKISSVLLPGIYDSTDIRLLIPLYERIYFPIPYEESEAKLIYGISKKEMLSLIQLGKMVPVISQRFGRYSTNVIKEYLEVGNCITPRQLTLALANDSIKRNPLWLLALTNIDLAREIINYLKKSLENHDREQQDSRVLDLTKIWLDFQVEGCINFDNCILNQGTLSPLYLGPGAFAAKVLPHLIQGDKLPDLEMMFGGIELSHATALGASCFPVMKENVQLYEFIAGIYSPKKLSVIDDIPILVEVDAVLKEISITCPKDIDAVDWANTIDKSEIHQLRIILKKAFKGCTAKDLPKMQDVAKKLAHQTEQYSSRSEKIDMLVDKLDILGATTETLFLSSDFSLPFAGWALGTLIKNGSPLLWEQISKYHLVREAQTILEGILTFSSFNAVRLHKTRCKFNNSK